MNDERIRENSRQLVRAFGAVSDCEPSLADIQWLTKNIESAIRAALAEGMPSEEEIARVSAEYARENYGEPDPDNFKERIAYHSHYVGMRWLRSRPPTQERGETK